MADINVPCHLFTLLIHSRWDPAMIVREESIPDTRLFDISEWRSDLSRRGKRYFWPHCRFVTFLFFFFLSIFFFFLPVMILSAILLSTDENFKKLVNCFKITRTKLCVFSLIFFYCLFLYSTVFFFLVFFLFERFSNCFRVI